ncbi:MAG TPA: hypothetical protein VGJ25_10330 [Gaiellaceae bacterium]|jgi:hypothetical protein
MGEIHSFRSHLPVRVSFGDAVSELPTVLESEGAQDALAIRRGCLTVNPRTWDAADVRSAFEAALTLIAR